jgi:hypothetical protein
MKVIYMAETLYLLGDEKATALIPKGTVKRTEEGIQYLVINDDKL